MEEQDLWQGEDSLSEGDTVDKRDITTLMWRIASGNDGWQMAEEWAKVAFKQEKEVGVNLETLKTIRDSFWQKVNTIPYFEGSDEFWILNQSQKTIYCICPMTVFDQIQSQENMVSTLLWFTPEGKKTSIPLKALRT